MLLLHPHYILLHPLYTCPALFGLMLLHIFFDISGENGLHWLSIYDERRTYR